MNSPLVDPRYTAPTGSTLSFLREHLPPLSRTIGARTGGLRIVEVGCGEGHLAAALAAAGHAVLALDQDPRAVESAAAKGVRAEQAQWPDCEVDATDVVLFTRSLHHVDDLDACLDRAAAVLGPAGRVIAEDYDIGGIDPRGAAWLYGVLRVLEAAGALAADLPGTPEAHGFGAQLLGNGGDLVEALGHEDLHSAERMAAALRERFDEVEVRPAPYFYRYALPLLPANDTGGAVLARLLEAEVELLARGVFAPLGRRLVAGSPRA